MTTTVTLDMDEVRPLLGKVLERVAREYNYPPDSADLCTHENRRAAVMFALGLAARQPMDDALAIFDSDDEDFDVDWGDEYETEDWSNPAADPMDGPDMRVVRPRARGRRRKE